MCSPQSMKVWGGEREDLREERGVTDTRLLDTIVQAGSDERGETR